MRAPHAPVGADGAPDDVLAPIRLDGHVVVITGAGNGLGRQYALALAERGARVVVNDLGAALDGTLDGSGASLRTAQAVVDEITRAGGTAEANGDDVGTPDGAARLMAQALDVFGRVDALVCNAGILRDGSFAKQPLADFERVLRVHLLGTVYACKAAFPPMRAQGYGRVVLTTSAAGLYGNFGQTAYAAAKLGVVGFLHALRLEAEPQGVLVNAVSPLAMTRMAEGVFPARVAGLLRPELVAPLVTYLCSPQCTTSGDILTAGAGGYARAAVVEGPGVDFGPDTAVTPEQIAAAYSAIRDLHGASAFRTAADALGALAERPAVRGASAPEESTTPAAGRTGDAHVVGAGADGETRAGGPRAPR